MFLFAAVYSSSVFFFFFFVVFVVVFFVLYLFSNFITVIGIFKFHLRSRLLCLSRSHHHLNPDV